MATNITLNAEKSRVGVGDSIKFYLSGEPNTKYGIYIDRPRKIDFAINVLDEETDASGKATYTWSPMEAYVGVHRFYARHQTWGVDNESKRITIEVVDAVVVPPDVPITPPPIPEPEEDCIPVGGYDWLGFGLECCPGLVRGTLGFCAKPEVVDDFPPDNDDDVPPTPDDIPPHNDDEEEDDEVVDDIWKIIAIGTMILITIIILQGRVR